MIALFLPLSLIYFQYKKSLKFAILDKFLLVDLKKGDDIIMFWPLPPYHHQPSSFHNPLPPLKWWRNLWTAPYQTVLEFLSTLIIVGLSIRGFD